jgi:hypothetical protein
MIVYNYEDNIVTPKTVTEQEKQSVADDISSKWSSWSKGIDELRTNREKMVEGSKPKSCKKDETDWHSKIELNRMHQFKNKLYGILYETFFDKISSYLKMGKENFDKVYYKALNIENKKELLVSVNDMLEYGEVVASAELKNTYRKEVFPIARITEFAAEDIVSVKADSFVARIAGEPEINFIRINPVNFAYDPLIVPGTKDFDTCDKIVKMWKTKQEILKNKSYEITKEELDRIFGDSYTPNVESQDKSDRDMVYRQNQIEVLTYYGDFVIDGKYYNDYVAVVVGRSKLVYFAPRNIYTPGIYYYAFNAAGNGSRGVSPLFYILDLCELEQKTLNDSVDFVQLQKNPPSYAPVGFFEEEVTKLEPGKHITYKLGMQDPTAIIPINFTAQPLMVFEAATKQLTEEIAGIDNGRLSEKSEALTQEEVRRVAQSENLIPNMIISGIMLNIVSKYLTDCIEIIEGAERETTLVKTAWEYANEQIQMQNVVALLKEVGANDPSMVNLQASAYKAFEALGVNPAEYLNDGRNSQILQNLAGMSDEVLAKLYETAQQLQIEENNRIKASKLMAQLQDQEYKKQLRETWEATGSLPEDIVVPNGQGQMVVPVAPITPAAQVKNKVSTTAD